MKLSLSVQTPEVQFAAPVALLTGTFEEKVTKAAALGAQGLELMPVDPAALDAPALCASMERAGLEAAAIGSTLLGAVGLTLLQADTEKVAQARARLRDLIDFAAAVGAPLVTIGSVRGRAATVGAGAREQLVAMLREAAVYAASSGVRLVLEPINRYQLDLVNSVEEALAFVEEVSHTALGLLLDTCHMNMEESSWPGPFERATAAGRLWHVHVADNNRLAPGRGLLDFAAIVAILRQVGYTGYLSAEVLAWPDPDQAAQDTLAHLRPLLRQH
jgi:sugar phosphate isomerase/epimerase